MVQDTHTLPYFWKETEGVAEGQVNAKSLHDAVTEIRRHLTVGPFRVYEDVGYTTLMISIKGGEHHILHRGQCAECGEEMEEEASEEGQRLIDLGPIDALTSIENTAECIRSLLPHIPIENLPEVTTEVNLIRRELNDLFEGLQ